MRDTEENEMVRLLAEKAASLGGRTYYVGGCVRDSLMGAECGDVDVEIHGLRREELENVLDSMGRKLVMGKSFGIYRLAGVNVDIALPRRERQTGEKHTDFDIEVDPFIGTEKAASRRDFTVNSIMRDVLTGEIVDHFGGVNDIENKILRHTNDASFAEDSLRVFRCAMFASRLGFSVSPDTVSLCRGMDVSSLSAERVNGETKKALLLSQKPSVYFETLREMGHLSVWYPELEALIGVEQDPTRHPEGDVWTHTMLVLDRAVKYREKAKNPYAFMLACLSHDMGKAVSTETINGVIHAYGHETSGISIAEKFVTRLTNEKEILRYVTNFVRLHMKPNITARASSAVRTTNRMFDESIDPVSLIGFSECDSGKSDNLPWLEERYKIYLDYMSRPFVTGRDLIGAGVTPGEDFSALLAFAHKLRLAGVPKEQAIRQTLKTKK